MKLQLVALLAAALLPRITLAQPAVSRPSDSSKQKYTEPVAPNHTRRCVISDFGARPDAATVNTRASSPPSTPAPPPADPSHPQRHLPHRSPLPQARRRRPRRTGRHPQRHHRHQRLPRTPRNSPAALEGGGTAALLNADGLTNLDPLRRRHDRRLRRSLGAEPPPPSRRRHRPHARRDRPRTPPPPRHQKRPTRPRLRPHPPQPGRLVPLVPLFGTTWSPKTSTSPPTTLFPPPTVSTSTPPRHVRVSRVFIDVNDDCISIKSGKDADGLRVNRPSENILIENSHFA